MNDKCFEVEDSLSSQGCFVGMNGEPRDPGSYGTTLEYDKLKDAIVKHNDDELRDFVNQYVDDSSVPILKLTALTIKRWRKLT